MRKSSIYGQLPPRGTPIQFRTKGDLLHNFLGAFYRQCSSRPFGIKEQWLFIHRPAFSQARLDYCQIRLSGVTKDHTLISFPLSLWPTALIVSCPALSIPICAWWESSTWSKSPPLLGVICASKKNVLTECGISDRWPENYRGESEKPPRGWFSYLRLLLSVPPLSLESENKQKLPGIC